MTESKGVHILDGREVTFETREDRIQHAISRMVGMHFAIWKDFPDDKGNKVAILDGIGFVVDVLEELKGE